ncbi:endo-1,3-beta glucanase [Cytospora paraplurivora]|uniref:glucan endo-1,3-beta-D-glucosidase n=1 Tax=Cytospora paraplurivora TaxID=2898453 RepID=A0AAN9U3P0_9PEZI
MVIKLATSMEAATVDNDIFEAPIATSAPPSSIVQRSDHPVPRLGIQQTSVISTNKFYQNFFLGSQGSTTVVHPYSVAWAKGQGVAQSWGLAISHIDANQLAFGPTNSYGATNFFINPIGIQSLVLSASELGSSTSLTTTHITDMSAVVQLRASAASAPVIEFPLVQGSGFITAEYEGATPIIQTGVFFLTVTKVNTEPRPGVTKYKIKLNDGKDWLLYAYSTSGSPLELQVVNNGLIRAKSAFTGTIQVAKDPGNGEALYDAASGQYATGVSLSATARGMRGTYTFNFEKAGLVDAPLLMFALPHHVQSFDDTTAAAVKSGLQLQTTTKGIATAVVADTWTLVEPRLPISMSFVPWTSYEGSKKALSEAEKARILKVARLELSQDIGAQTNLNSMYFSGKALAKFAMILAVVYDMLGDSALAAAGLEKLKAAFAVFASNKQIFPLTYESAWGGIVSSASYQTGDSGADFGNTYYNDHHFHYGYHVLAAAVIAHLDPKWLDANKDYVNTLVRDFANPSAKDTWFPQNRMFDWYHGHSFAHGLYESADGRDQESSSEDTMASYALKMWGLVSGDANMAARGNLQLSVLARSANNYFLYTSGNTIQPANFIGNKVAGILFENKIDHTTYFGANIEYIQGIHMLPLIPATQLVRGQDFVAEEWDQYFNAGRADKVDGGWRGVLYGNLATIDPKAAFDFFSKDGFDQSWLDGGASLTWYLAYSAALAGL